MAFNYLKILILCVVIKLSLSQFNNGMRKPKRSLVIVFDVTGSMSDEINALRKGVLILLDSFHNQPDNPISNYIFIQFRDEIADTEIIPPIVLSSYTEIVQILKSFSINDRKNPDCPESCFNGIKRGLDLANDDSFVFVFTDAGTHEKHLEPELFRLIQKKRAKIYFFLTTGCDHKDFANDYRNLAEKANSLVFEVDYTGIEELFPKYSELINDKLDFSSQFGGPGGNSTIDVMVDSSIKNFTFTIVAQKPLIKIYDPKQILVQDFENLSNLSSVKMIRIKDPIPGKWTVEIQTTTPYAGQISVISDLSFKYGFLIREPDDFMQTSFNPMIGQNNYLAILPSDTSLIGNLEYVVLETKTKKHKFILRKKTVTDGDLYITESLKLPQEAFKVVLYGVDPLNYEISRLLSPDIMSRDPDRPETDNIDKILVQEGQPIYLICRVDSMINVTVSWWKVGDSKPLKTVSSMQSIILNHTIPESDLNDNGDYKCMATNSAGQSESKTIVDVRRTVLNVHTPIKQHWPKVGTRILVLKCVVIPKIASVKISWLFNGGTNLPLGATLNLPNLILHNIDRNYNGTYTCSAQRKSETMADDIEVNVIYAAKILNIFKLKPYGVIDTNTPIELYDRSNLKILCGIDGSPAPDVKWVNQNGVIVSNTSVLVVNGNDPKQSGDYMCQVQNSLGADEKHIQVVIEIKPKLLERFENHYRVKIGEQFSLECPLEAIPDNMVNIFWYHNTSQIDSSLISNDHINIDKLEHAHNGKYKCQASNQAGAVEVEFNVDVLFETNILHIVKHDSTGSDVLDSHVTQLDIFNVTKFLLTCIANGNPLPDTIWQKNGVLFSHTNQLEIVPTITGFSGTYKCVAHNELNTDDRVIQLFEIVKPIMSQYEVKQNLIEDKEFRLICPVEPSTSIHNVTWYFNDKNFDQHTHPDGSLFIKRVYPYMTGRIYCVATNEAGSAVATFIVDVLRPPFGLTTATSSIKYPIQQKAPNLKQITIRRDEPLDITCNAQGNPTPTIDWLKNGKLFSNEKTIEIRSIQTKDEATYTCVAANQVGRQIEKVILTVHEMPYLLNSTGLDYGTGTNNVNKTKLTVLNRINVPTTYFDANYEQHVEVNENENVLLDCSMNGRPMPTIDWLKNNENLERQTAILELTSVKIDNSGIYKCIGDSGYGKISVIFYLIVQKPPLIISATPSHKTETGNIAKMPFQEGQPIYLICRVDSMINVTVSWWKVGDSKPLKTVSSMESTILNHTIPESDLNDNGDYKCIATNSAGQSESKTNVDIRRTVVNVHTPIKQHWPKVGTRILVLKCVVTPKIASIKISWLFNGGTNLPLGATLNLPNLILHNIDRNYNGTYTCSAQRKSETMADDIEVNVIYAAKILNIFKLKPYGVIDTNTPIELYDRSNLKILCGIDGSPAPDVKWVNQNGVIVSNTSVLVVNGNDPKQSGDYMCQVQNSLGADEKHIQVVIEIKPKLLERFENHYRVKIGEQFSLECPLEAIPDNMVNIFWYHNTSQIDSSLISNDHINIDKLEHAHNGKYKCQASNQAGAVEVEFNVDVLFETNILHIVKHDSTGSDVLDSHVTQLDIFNVTKFLLTCIANGNPLPDTIWQKNGVLFSHTNQLEIVPTITGFSGTYKCVAQNELNTDDRVIQLFEIVKPIMSQYEVKQNLIEDKEFRLICPVEPSTSIHNVTWYFNDKNFDQHTHPDGSLFIKRVYPYMTGRIYCVATNEAGSAVATFIVDVLRPPFGLTTATSSIKYPIQQKAPNLKQITIRRDEPLDITCNAQGNPTPTIDWLKNGKLFSNEKTIEIRSIQTKDEATYTCVAANQVGRQIEKVILTVHEMPYLLNSTGLDYGTGTNNVNKTKLTVLNRINVPTTYFDANYEQHVEVNENENVLLDCSMNGRPMPTIDWLKNNENLERQTAILELTSVKIDNSGIYKCIGDSGYGKISVIFYLIVQKPPLIISATPSHKTETGNIAKMPFQEGQPIYLICRVDSMINVTVSWWKVGDSKPLKTVSSMESTILNHTIPESDLNDNGDYKCIATNSAGQSESKTNVDIRRTVVNVHTPIKQHWPKVGTRILVLKCVVTPKIASIKISWLFNGGTNLPLGATLNLPNLILHNIDRNYNGTYTCSAQRKSETMTDDIEVNVIYAAKILNIFKLKPYGVIDTKTPIELYDRSNLKILCGIDGSPAPDVKWVNQNGVIVSNTSVLVVNGNDPKQSGDYMCQVQNSLGADEKHIQVVIEIKPKLLERFENHYRVKIGEQFSLECPLEAIPDNMVNIFWYHNTSQIDSSLISNDHINIDKLEHAHNGKYKCQASNQAGAVEVEFNVDVLFETNILHIVKHDSTGSDVLDSHVTQLDIFNVTKFLLTCIANGNPLPDTIWQKNGVLFSHTNQLEIVPTITGFSGTYKCVAQNELNTDDRVIQLFEIVKPIMSQYEVKQNLIEDKEFRLICPVEPSTSIHNVTWYFNDKNFDQHTHPDGSLFIKRVYPYMTGRIYCVATNEAGSAVATFIVDVLRPPFGLTTATSSIKYPIQQKAPNLKQITIRRDEPLDITCNAQGNPTPTIDWLKNGKLFSNEKTIEIRSIQTKDEATYTCVAANQVGRQIEKVILTVHEMPYLLNSTGLDYGTGTNNVNKTKLTVLNRINVPTTYFEANYEQHVEVNENENVLFDCSMNGSPVPTIDWFKNNENLERQTAILELTSVKIDNSGIYKCIGDSGYGKLSVIFYLIVQKPHLIISAIPSKLVYALGEEIKFTCKTKGNQLPVIKWSGFGNSTDNENLFKSKGNDHWKKLLLQDNEPMYLKGKKLFTELNHFDSSKSYGKISYDFIENEYIGSLDYVIRSANLDNSGQYKCTSRIYKNKTSAVSKTVDIEVVEVPHQYSSNVETEYTILQGIESTKIICPIKGTPNPSFEWYHNNDEIVSNLLIQIRNNSLVLKSPMLHNAGNYSCRGTNNGGMAEFKFQVIIIQHIANISDIVLNRSRKTKIEVIKHQTKELKCSIDGVLIDWSKIIYSYPIKQRQLLGKYASYNFSAIQSETIMCTKSSYNPEPHGEIFEITVLEKPTIRLTDSIIEVKLDDVLRLQCDATGEPKPTITWYKYEKEQKYDIQNYKSFEQHGEIIIKRRAENSDTEKYVCIARNHLGNDSKMFNVTVLNDSHYFAPWSDWSTCSQTCNDGIQFKIRDCVHASCNQTQQRKVQKCRTIGCPIDGGWSDYSKFEPCPKSCVLNVVEVPTKQARRKCNNPTPAFGGKHCIGKSVRIVNCTVPLCESIHDKLDYSSCSDQEICCPAGFEYDVVTGGCPEIDKCKRKGHFKVCDHESLMCRNVGTDDYECVCRPGFKLQQSENQNNTKKSKCVDIDECNEEPYICGDKNCSNNIGSYKCY